MRRKETEISDASLKGPHTQALLPTWGTGSGMKALARSDRERVKYLMPELGLDR